MFGVNKIFAIIKNSNELIKKLVKSKIRKLLKSRKLFKFQKLVKSTENCQKRGIYLNLILKN